jgi:hypothetical protein
VNNVLQLLQRLSARKFLSDAPSASDLENWGFNRPEREVMLNVNTGGGPHGTDGSILTLQIGMKPEDRTVAFARAANAPFVYEIDPAILGAMPDSASHFRQRVLRDLPVGASVTGITLSEIGSPTPIYAHQLPEGIASWDIALGLEPEGRHKALVALLAQVHSLRAKRFVANSFNPDHAETEGGAVPWKYRLDVTLALTGGNGTAQSSTSTLFLTDRLGGGTQVAGTTDFTGVTFELAPEMLDALFALTYAEKNDPGPRAKPVEPAPADVPKPGAPDGK